MRKLVLGLAFVAAIVCSRQADAQTWSAPVPGFGSGWCPNCYVVGAVDIPNAGAPFAGHFDGWGGECASGQPLTSVEVYYQRPGEFYRATARVLFLGQVRDDVAIYFANGGTATLPDGPFARGATVTCPQMSNQTGWSVYTALPSGTWDITIVLGYGAVKSSITGTVSVP